MNVATKRRKRRRAKAQLTKGKNSVRAHREKTGRTGQIWEKHTPGKTSKFSHVFTNSPWQVRIDRAPV
jgi:hypothetical protein